MVHPSELLRTNSNEGREFSAPRNITEENQIDCGLTNLPILNRCCNLEKFAKPKVFLVFLSLVGFLQGVTLTYFRDTSKIWGQHYNINKENIDWLIYTNEFFVGIIALIVAYWGNRIHRMSWIGGLTIFQAIASAILIIPEIYNRNLRVDTIDLNLCKHSPLPISSEIEVNYIAVVILGIFQIFYAMSAVSFITHGITYLDDNSSVNQSPGYIGVALACKELGRQAGLYLSFLPNLSKNDAIFLSPVWLLLVAFTFISGILIAMFPKNMPSAILERMAASIIDLASGQHAPIIRKQKVDGFFKTILRLFKNKILMVNIMCLTCLQSGFINYQIFENFLNQSRFQISSVTDNSYTQLSANLLKQPLVAISMIATGMVIAKIKPNLKNLVKWNITMLILVIIFFGSTTFLRCEPKTKYGHMLSNKFCSNHCNCSFDEFQPVCVNSETYYSPCLANCNSIEEVNSRKIYKCTCNGKVHTAAEGPCNAEKCNVFYSLSQANSVITTALLASTLVTNLIINMRCILSKDKAAALGLEATFTSLIPFLPVKAIYGAVAETFCIHRSKDKEKVCRLFNENFALFLSATTIGFVVLSLILSIVVMFLMKHYLKVEKDFDDEGEDEEIQEMTNRPMEENRLMNNETKKSNETLPESLLEMENIGDDHDSLNSASFLDDRPIQTNSRITESDL